MLAGREGAMSTERKHQCIRTQCLSESDRREIEAYVGAGERIADFVCRAGTALRSAAAYVRKSLAQRETDPLA
jgi:hypothetical protein